MKKLIAALCFAFAASAVASGQIIVDTPSECPGGTVATVTAHKRVNGQWVMVGWICESLYTGG